MNNDRFKFRGYSKITKQIIDLQNVTPLALNSDKLNGVFIPFHDDIIIEQCTGLRDKNGELIYEGDVVKHEWDGVIHIIEFDDLCSWFKARYANYDDHEHICDIHDHVIIIGNIHHDSHLLDNDKGYEGGTNGGN